jgi:hypothetical protein
MLPREHTLKCYSFSCTGQSDQHTDKIILPVSVMAEADRCDITFPLFFKLKNARVQMKAAVVKAGKRSTETKLQSLVEVPAGSGELYCGVLEFSAPADHAYIPNWIMEQLGLREGCRVTVTHAEVPPPATFCVFEALEPESFAQVLRVIGPKAFLEAALRSYSCLQIQRGVVFVHQARDYLLTVTKLKASKCPFPYASPEVCEVSVASLLGSVDLEVEFSFPNMSSAENLLTTAVNDHSDRNYLAAEDKANAFENSEIRFETTAKSNTENTNLDLGWAVKAPIFSGKRGDGAEINGNTIKVRSAEWRLAHHISGGSGVGGLKKKAEADVGPISEEKVGGQSKMLTQTHSKDFSVPAEREFSQSDEEDTEPHSQERDCQLQASEGQERRCELCRHLIPLSSWALHSVRCGRLHASCPDCLKPVPRARLALHRASHTPAPCPHCHATLPARRIARHVANRCPDAPLWCTFCGESVRRVAHASHMLQCGERTVECGACNERVPVREWVGEDSGGTVGGANANGPGMVVRIGEEGLAKVCPAAGAHAAACRPKCQCGEKMSVAILSDHMASACPLRLLRCRYCELHVPAQDHDRHVAYCGSRTDNCTFCHALVRLSCMDDHMAMGCPPEPSAQESNGNNRNKYHYHHGNGPKVLENNFKNLHFGGGEASSSAREKVSKEHMREDALLAEVEHPDAHARVQTADISVHRSTRKLKSPAPYWY